MRDHCDCWIFAEVPFVENDSYTWDGLMYTCSRQTAVESVFVLILVLLMDNILHQLGWSKHWKYRDVYGSRASPNLGKLWRYKTSCIDRPWTMTYIDYLYMDGMGIWTMWPASLDDSYPSHSLVKHEDSKWLKPSKDMGCTAYQLTQTCFPSTVGLDF